MKMKRIIISPAQLRAINEAAAAFTYGDGDFAERLTDFKNSNPAVKTPIIGVNTGETATGVSTTDTTKANTAKQTIVTGSTTGSSLQTNRVESRFSKRQVERGRLLEMKRNGKVFSKRQLNEMFMETQENAERLRREIGKCRLYDIFDAIEEVFPEELENAKNVVGSGADLPEFLCSLFSKEGVDSNREEEFLDMLGI